MTAADVMFFEHRMSCVSRGEHAPIEDRKLKARIMMTFYRADA